MKNFFKKLFCSDSMSKHFSETVQRVGKNNAGFSLVELIVVIAIMAILAAVAVIGVSVYIPYSQKAADEQMIADVQKAIDLYATGESLTPGQSGYVVIHKNGGVSVGGTLDAAPGQLITNALKATFGENYNSELKVAYKGWTGEFSKDEYTSISNSTFIKNPTDLLETVQTLTDAMKGYYGAGATNADANKAVLDIAAGTQGVDKDAFVAWWMSKSFEMPATDDMFNFPAEGMDDNDKLKIKLAAVYAKGKAFVMSTNCDECQNAFNGTDIEGGYFNDIHSAGDAQIALNSIVTAVSGHLGECSSCANHYDNVYFSSATAKSDAESYVALLGKIDSMSDTIMASPEFQGDNLYTSGFIKDYVNEYASEVDAYGGAGNAQIGDIVVTVLVDQNGNLRYKNNLTE